MKSNNSFVFQKTTNSNFVKNNQFFKIQHVLINLYEKKIPKDKNIKIFDTPEPKTNSDTAIETITNSNSKIILKTIQTTETTEQENTNQKRHKPKIRRKKYCKLIEKFANSFNDIEKKNLNNSFCGNAVLIEKKINKFISSKKNSLVKNNNKINNKIQNTINIPRKKWEYNYEVDSNLKKYRTLSASIKNKNLNNKNRKIPKQLEITNKINYVNLFNQNKFFNPYFKEVNYYTSENSKIDMKNFEFDEIAQRRPGHNKLKINNYNDAKSKKNTNPNTTKINFKKKKLEILNFCSDIEFNPRNSNNLKKFKERKKKLNDPSPIPSNKKIINIRIKDLKNKNNIGLKKLSTKNIFSKNKLIKRKKLFIKTTEYSPKILDGRETSYYLSNKKQITLGNSQKSHIQKSKNFITMPNFRFFEVGKIVKN